MRRGLKLELPLENASARGGCFGLGDVSGCLQRNRKRCVRERIGRCKHGESECSRDRLLRATRVAQGADEAMMGLDVGRIRGNGPTKCLGGLFRNTLSQKVQALLRECCGAS